MNGASGSTGVVYFRNRLLKYLLNKSTNDKCKAKVSIRILLFVRLRMHVYRSL